MVAQWNCSILGTAAKLKRALCEYNEGVLEVCDLVSLGGEEVDSAPRHDLDLDAVCLGSENILEVRGEGWDCRNFCESSDFWSVDRFSWQVGRLQRPSDNSRSCSVFQKDKLRSKSMGS